MDDEVKDQNTTEPGAPDSSLHDEIEKSKEKIKNEQQAKPLKRKYVRTGKYAKDPANISPSPSVEVPAADIGIKPEELDALMADASKVPFAIFAARTKCLALELSNDEAGTLGRGMSAIFRTYLPQFASQHAVLFTFLMSASMITYNKFKIYEAWRAKNDNAGKPA